MPAEPEGISLCTAVGLLALEKLLLRIERVERLKMRVRRAVDTLRLNSGYAASWDSKLPIVNGDGRA